MGTNPFNTTTGGLTPNANLLGTPGAITATSTTSQAIALGTLVFQVQPQAAWAPGMFVTVVYASDSTKSMVGTVTSYSGTTLTLDILTSSGSGTYANWLINLSGAVGPTGATGATGANAGPQLGSAIGLKVKNNVSTPSLKIDITAAVAVMNSSTGVTAFNTNVAVTIDLTTGTSTAAANGMDGESRPASGWVYLYLISNGTTVAGLATKSSPSAAAPTMPSGYTYSLYVGAMPLDSSSNLMRVTLLGKEGAFNVVASTNTPNLPEIATGVAGSVSTPTYVSLAIGSYAPATASVIRILAVYNGDSGNILIAPNNAYGAYHQAGNPPYAFGVAGTAFAYLPMDVQLESTNIYWASDNTGNQINAMGWKDNYVAA